MSENHPPLFEESMHKSTPLTSPIVRRPFGQLSLNTMNQMNQPPAFPLNCAPASPVHQPNDGFSLSQHSSPRVPFQNGFPQPAPMSYSPTGSPNGSPQCSPRQHAVQHPLDHNLGSRIPSPVSSPRMQPLRPGWPPSSPWVQPQQAPAAVPTQPRGPAPLGGLSPQAFIQTLLRNPNLQKILQQNPQLAKHLPMISLIQSISRQQQQQQSHQQPQHNPRPPPPQRVSTPWASGHTHPMSEYDFESTPAEVIRPDHVGERGSVLDDMQFDVDNATPEELRVRVESLQTEVINRNEDIANYKKSEDRMRMDFKSMQEDLEMKQRVLQTVQSKYDLAQQKLRRTEGQLEELEEANDQLIQGNGTPSKDGGNQVKVTPKQNRGVGRNSMFSTPVRRKLSPSRGQKLNVDFKHQMQLADIRMKRLKDELDCLKTENAKLNETIDNLREGNDRLIEVERGLVHWKQTAENYHDRMKDACEAKAFADAKSEELVAVLRTMKKKCESATAEAGEKNELNSELQRQLGELKLRATNSQMNHEAASDLQQRLKDAQEDLIRENFVHEQQLKALEDQYKHEAYRQKYHERATMCNMLEKLVDDVIDLPHNLKPNPQVIDGLNSWFVELQQAQNALRFAQENFENEVNRRVQSHDAQARERLSEMNRKLNESFQTIQQHKAEEVDLVVQSVVEDLVWQTVCGVMEVEIASAKETEPGLPARQARGQQRMLDIQKCEIERLDRELREFRDRYERLHQQYASVSIIQAEEGRMIDEHEDQRQKICALRFELEQKIEQIIEMEKKHSNLLIQLARAEEVEKELSRVRSEVNALERIQGEMRRNLEEEENKRKEATSELNRVRGENRRKLSSNMTKMENLRSQLSNVQEANAVMNSHRMRLEKEKQNLVSQLQNLEKRHHNLEEKLHSVQGETERHESERRGLEQERIRLSSLCQHNENVIKTLSQEIEELRGRYSQAMKEKEIIERQVAQLQSHVDKASRSSNELRNLQKEYDQVKTVLKHYQSQYLNEPVDPVRELDQKLKLQKTVETLRAELNQMNQQCEKIASDKRELREIARTIHNEGQTKLTKIAHRLRFMSNLAETSYRALRSEQEFVRGNAVLSQHLQFLNKEMIKYSDVASQDTDAELS